MKPGRATRHNSAGLPGVLRLTFPGYSIGFTGFTVKTRVGVGMGVCISGCSNPSFFLGSPSRSPILYILYLAELLQKSSGIRFVYVDDIGILCDDNDGNLARNILRVANAVRRGTLPPYRATVEPAVCFSRSKPTRVLYSQSS